MAFNYMAVLKSVQVLRRLAPDMARFRSWIARRDRHSAWR